MEQSSYDDDELLTPATERWSAYRLATQTVVHRPVASAAPGNWLEMQTAWPHLGPIKSEPLGAESRNLLLVNLSFLQ